MGVWTRKFFEAECQAWISRLAVNPRADEQVCDMFCEWQQLQSSSFLYRRATPSNIAIHIAWSPSYRCPLLLLRDMGSPLRLFNLSPGYEGTLDYHPDAAMQSSQGGGGVYFTIHACETLARLEVLLLSSSQGTPPPSGMALLQWWAMMVNCALVQEDDFVRHVRLPPAVFNLACQELSLSLSLNNYVINT